MWLSGIRTGRCRERLNGYASGLITAICRWRLPASCEGPCHMKLFAINAEPGRITATILSWFLFAAGIAFYFYTATERHRENPDDRVVPTIGQLGDGLHDAAF